MNKFTSMHMFCRVVELGSFVAVARETGFSTTMVCKHVANMEKSLGVSLLNRTTRKLNLTEVGTNYYQGCKQLLEDMEDLEASMSQLGGKPQGKLRVIAPIDFGSMHMVPVIQKYQESYPNVAVEISLENRTINISEGVYDLAIRLTDVTQPGLIAKSIAPAELCTYASPGYIRQYEEPKTVKQLTAHRCLHFIDTPHGDSWVFQYENQLYHFKPKWHFASNNSRILCEAASLGMGIIQVPNVSVTPYVISGELVEILHNYRLPTLNVFAIYQHRRFIPAKISSFVNFITDYFKHYQNW